MANAFSGLHVGQTVHLQDGRTGTLRYAGDTHFAPGDWIGVELETATGKNDGSVQGERYFDCDIGYGMFVRPTVVTVLDQPLPPKRESTANGSAKDKRPPVSVVPKGSNRSSVTGTIAKRQTVNAASPTRSSRPSVGPRSLLADQVAYEATVIERIIGHVDAPNRNSLHDRCSSAIWSQVFDGSRLGSTSTASPRPSENRVSSKPIPAPAFRRLNSVGGASQASESSGQESQDEGKDTDSFPLPRGDSTEDASPTRTSPVNGRAPPIKSMSGKGSPRGLAPSVATQRSANTNTAVNREAEDLKTKLRMMEKKRMEDRDKLKILEKVTGDRDKFEAIIQKLQSKYQPQQQELTELKKQLKETETKAQEVETLHADQEVVVEMATLDREMAEETAEAMRTELEATQRKAEELQLEVEILREENQELGQEMSPEEKTSQGWLQMERTNERLREALLRLRDITEQQESDLKDQVRGLAADMEEMLGVKERYDATREKLLQAEAGIEDLKQQLEIAEGAEAIIEELGEKNEKMTEEIEELKACIEDLESLKELTDELEVNHVETEKQLQDEIDYKDILIAEHGRRSVQHQGTMEDYEYTIARFRELVTNLQSDLDDMKASQQITETEADELTSRSRAMMDLNMKLQLSVSKTQVKTIDLELKRLDAQEAAEHLAIVQLFLPESFQAERDSVLALLRFRRIGFKANMVHGFVKERVTGETPHGRDDDVFAGYQVLDELTWISAMCDRFVGSITSASVEQFAKYEGALYELEPVERALNGWIDGSRRDELSHKQCASDLQRSMALMSHLAEIHITDSLESYADDLQMRVALMQSNLENMASAMSHLKTMARTKVSRTEEDRGATEHFYKQLDTVVSQSRSGKVILGKTARALTELNSRSLSLSEDALSSFENCQDTTHGLSQCSRQIGDKVFDLLSEEGRSELVTYQDIQSTMSGVTASAYSTTDTDALSVMLSRLRVLINDATELNNIASDLSLTHEFERPTAPWVLRSQEIRSAKLVSVDTEEELRRLRDDIHERATQIRLRDISLEESAVKIELLESRTRDINKNRDRIAELERALADARSREKDLNDAIESQVRELQALEIEREKLRKSATAERRPVADSTSTTAATTTADPNKHGGLANRAVASAHELAALHAEIHSLQAAVRYLREDNRRARLTAPPHGTGLAWLDEPLHAPRSKQQQRANLLHAEGHDVLHELLNLSASAKVFDLRHTPQNRLAWRPAKTTPRWHAGRQREEWERLREWQGEVVRKGKGYGYGYGVGGAKKAGQGPGVVHAARVDVRMPWLEMKGMGKERVGPVEVRIVEPGDFEEFREGLVGGGAG
ncbi:MAG: hypothetical protein M1833_006740 [Piccolia ochrophora]|nr:MAG: hypothetical protein M1833_006740 [Piccolia ochrophora]